MNRSAANILCHGRRCGTGAMISQTDVVVQGIRSLIVEGKLRPGDRLPVEKDLAGALVSRNPLREGVRALSVMGVLETRQGAGTYVTALDSRCCWYRWGSSWICTTAVARTICTPYDGCSRPRRLRWPPSRSVRTT